MKLPWKKAEDAADTASDTQTALADAVPVSGPGAFTEGKGRPTPKRRDAQKRKRGPVAPAPATRAEARARKKDLNQKLTPQERKTQAAARRSERAEQRERMMDGEEKYLTPRDQGEVRRYTRNIVDSRRNVAGLFMPMAILLLLIMFFPALMQYSTIVMLVFVVVLAVDGVILARLVNKRVAERFPDSTDGGFKLGWYAFNRAMMLRRMRAPRPQVNVGDAV